MSPRGAAAAWPEFVRERMEWLRPAHSVRAEMEAVRRLLEPHPELLAEWLPVAEWDLIQAEEREERAREIGEGNRRPTREQLRARSFAYEKAVRPRHRGRI